MINALFVKKTTKKYKKHNLSNQVHLSYYKNKKTKCIPLSNTFKTLRYS